MSAPPIIRTVKEAHALGREDAERGAKPRPFRVGKGANVRALREAYEHAYEDRCANPVQPLQSRIDQSADSFREFTGHEARGVRRVKVKEFSVGWPLGKLDGVLYSTVRDGKREKYIHRFRPKSRPHLVVNSDGTRLGIVGGRFRVKDSGINDV